MLQPTAATLMNRILARLLWIPKSLPLKGFTDKAKFTRHSKTPCETETSIYFYSQPAFF